MIVKETNGLCNLEQAILISIRRFDLFLGHFSIADKFVPLMYTAFRQGKIVSALYICIDCVCEHTTCNNFVKEVLCYMQLNLYPLFVHKHCS